MTCESNDGRFPDDSAVLARYLVDSRQPASIAMRGRGWLAPLSSSAARMNGWSR